MSAISYSSVEILPAWLRFYETKGKEGKITTMRPAIYHKYADIGFVTIKDDGKNKELNREKEHYKKTDKQLWFKPPRFKVGDIVKEYWNQRTSPPGSWFCKGCGTKVDTIKDENFMWCKGCELTWNTPLMLFPKLMGEVIIKAIEKIKMEIVGTELIVTKVNGIRDRVLNWHQTLQLALDDGFRKDHNPVDQMRDYFHKSFDLYKPKIFYRYHRGFVRSYV